MIMDELLEFLDAGSLNTGSAGSYLIGDVIDLGSASRNIGASDGLWLVIQVDTAVTSGGSATVQFHLVSDDSASIATDGSASYHFSTAAIAKATLVAGYQVCAVKLPSGTYERYLGILQTTGTAALTAGKVNAFLTADVPVTIAYPDAI